jgi:hypothetical protein
MIIEFLTALLKIFGVIAGCTFAILCVYGAWIVIALVHRFIYKRFEAYRILYDGITKGSCP